MEHKPSPPQAPPPPPPAAPNRLATAQPVMKAKPVPAWPKYLVGFMGLCTPGGFLLLIGLLTESNIRLDTPVWFILAGIGAVVGWFVGKKASS